MEEQKVSAQLAQQEKKIDAIYVSVEKTRKYFLATLIISVVAVALPLIGLIFVIPILFGNIQNSLDGLL